jgi:hypothetical protein
MYFPDRNPAGAEILDFAISNVLSSHSIRTIVSTSDHSPILQTITSPLEADEIKSNSIYHEANWKLFKII